MQTQLTKKVKPPVCHCIAYEFPHRLDGGKCRELYNEGSDDAYREQPLVSRTNDYAARMNEYGLTNKEFL